MNTENHYQETDLGNISIHLCGEYDPQRSYEYLDAVEFGGGSYICAIEYGKTITGIAPEPTKNTEYWHINSIPGTLTPEYIAMHDRVKNLSEQVEADAEEVRTAEQNVSGMELNVTQMQEQTRQSAEAAEQSKDSAAGYASSADASRQAAEESEENINAQITGFDVHVAEKTEEAENDIEATRIAANKAIIAQQEQSVNEVARVGIETVSTAQAAAQTATEKAQAADTSEKNAEASETAAKLSETNAMKMAEQVAADKEQVANDRTAVEKAKQEMTESVEQIDQNTQGISELKGDLKPIINGYELSLIPNSYVTSKGIILAFDGWSRTDYVPCILVNQLNIYSGAGSEYNAFYDAGKRFISTFTLNSGMNTIDVPTNASYFIMSNNDIGMTLTCVRSVVQEKISQNEKLAETVNTNLNDIRELFNTEYVQIDNVTSEKNYRWSFAGNKVESNGSTAIEFDAKAETNYDVCGRNIGTSTGFCVLFIDSDNEIISNISNATLSKDNHLHFTTPKRCVKVRYTQFTDDRYNSQKEAKYTSININDSEIIPEYYRTQLATKESIIRSHFKDCAFNGDGFVFLTDTHFSSDLFTSATPTSYFNANNSFSLIKDIISKCGIDKIVFGGDLVNGATDIDTMLLCMASFGRKFGDRQARLRYCVGNHEYFTGNDLGQTKKPTSYELYGAGIKYNEDVVIGKGDMDTYYFDNKAQKIRYFIISCGRDTETSVAQVKWILEQFEEIPQGYKVICIGHAFMADNMVEFRGGYKPIADALDAVKVGGTYTYVYGTNLSETYDYSALVDVTPVCMITGHTHIDGSLNTIGGIPCICTTTDSYVQNYELVDGKPTSSPRTKGTVDEQAFDVFQFDFTNRKIYVTRIGYGSDREFSY